ncbi:protein of unknown function [Magnetospirillum sp. XM-1]|nr:protein of unknown function [Magnetospirillum sp. XM-1]
MPGTLRPGIAPAKGLKRLKILIL